MEVPETCDQYNESSLYRLSTILVAETTAGLLWPGTYDIGLKTGSTVRTSQIDHENICHDIFKIRQKNIMNC